MASVHTCLDHDFTSANASSNPGRVHSFADIDTRRILTQVPPAMEVNNRILCRPARPGDKFACVSLHYLAEGAANVVFMMRPVDPFIPLSDEEPIVFEDNRGDTHPVANLLGSVLRISKGLQKTLGGEAVKKEFETEIAPMFRPEFEDQLLDLELVELDEAVLSILNRELSKHSHRGTKEIPMGTVGLLMDNMASISGTALTIEIKPKWLAQSPNAPRSDTYRCRTCALRGMRTQFSDDQKAFVCPLQLCAGNKELVGPFVYQKVLDAVHSSHLHILPETEAIAAGITDYLSTGRGHGILVHLRDLQNMLDTQGVVREEDPEIARALKALRQQNLELYEDEQDTYQHNLRLAMTLRDCSLFIRATYEKADGAFWTVSKVESKLGDLDFKSSRKWDDWQETEKALIADWYGWYTFGERGVEPFYDCLIAEQERTPKARR
ncbi:hypothetical protein K491DRAFT_130571 [Lophiostoma macrostomum CBS 122681]|uniref:Inositol-pentakisphosphate 2-kinase n=1 Tax=Lophiostoma macrostomum CBS 122681 TaxID=1314788 RepID=A0A6A6SV40_9PLEO|nr:hypothetical protein K491DRAFT_130571 [Lophiostoma macrostomum CBS 122681]